ncbi:MAG: CocE/NonD family hydrolase [Myxococcota bacterium]
MIQRLIRALLDLPPRRCPSWLERLWLPMPDGVRLATIHLWPVGLATAPVVVMRTPYGMTRFPRPLIGLGRLLCESGYHVVLQDVRGRHESEGQFRPFADEGRDGRALLGWVADQSWCDGRIGLIGVGYLAHAAWAALAEDPDRVRALVIGLGASDPYATFYSGGAFSLATALQWGVGIGDREQVPQREIDLERGLAYRPSREADRVALRQVDWYRDWVDHPRRDAFWDALRPALPPAPPPTLLLAGWYDIFLEAQLADHRALLDASRASGTAPPRLLIGPWSHGRMGHPSWGRRRRRLIGVAIRETLAFLDRQLRDADPSTDAADAGQRDAVRFYVIGADRWRDETSWPISGSTPRALYLRSSESTRSDRGDGALSWQPPPESEPPDRFTHEPDRPVPSLGGALLGKAGGAFDQRPVEGRPDVLCYTSAALEEKIEIAGAVRLVLHAASTAEDADFTAKLVDVAPDGTALNLCDGIARQRWSGQADDALQPSWLNPGEPARIEIELWATACVFRQGHRIRIEVSSSNFPRFDRNPQTREDPATAAAAAGCRAEQTVFHDAGRPSHVLLPVVPNASGPEA